MDTENKVCISIILINVGSTRNQISINKKKKGKKKVQIARNCYLKGIKVCISFILMNFRYHKSNINQQREEEKQKKDNVKLSKRSSSLYFEYFKSLSIIKKSIFKSISGIIVQMWINRDEVVFVFLFFNKCQV